MFTLLRFAKQIARRHRSAAKVRARCVRSVLMALSLVARGAVFFSSMGGAKFLPASFFLSRLVWLFLKVQFTEKHKRQKHDLWHPEPEGWRGENHPQRQLGRLFGTHWRARAADRCRPPRQRIGLGRCTPDRGRLRKRKIKHAKPLLTQMFDCSWHFHHGNCNCPTLAKCRTPLQIESQNTSRANQPSAVLTATARTHAFPPVEYGPPAAC